MDKRRKTYRPEITASKDLPARDCTQAAVMQVTGKGAVARVAVAMASQDVRYYLNGMYFEASENSLRSVATDGHGLASSAMTLPQSV